MQTTKLIELPNLGPKAHSYPIEVGCFLDHNT